MRAVRLHGVRSILATDYPEPHAVATGEVLIRVGAVGICGSDLHMYKTGRIGSIIHETPFVPGHEFMGTVLDVGLHAIDGMGQPLKIGSRVAVEPQVSCLKCEACETGNPNLCPHHTFFGVFPTDGALRERMVVPARNCFRIPDGISDAGGAVLETLGVALHALDLSRIRVGRSCAVLGCGPVGLLILRLAHLAGAHPLVAVDPKPWRAELARAWGATHIVRTHAEDAVREVIRATDGRGCDVVFEAAEAGAAVQAAVEIAMPGGKVVLVGIPGDDACALTHSVARRKGLTLLFSRRMKHVYPRAIPLAAGPQPRVDLDALVTHDFTLEETEEAFALNADYGDGIIKAVVHPART